MSLSGASTATKKRIRRLPKFTPTACMKPSRRFFARHRACRSRPHGWISPSTGSAKRRSSKRMCCCGGGTWPTAKSPMKWSIACSAACWKAWASSCCTRGTMQKFSSASWALPARSSGASRPTRNVSGTLRRIIRSPKASASISKSLPRRCTANLSGSRRPTS